MVAACAGYKGRVLRSPLAALLVALMAIGSIAMWLGVPAGLIYAASQVADSPDPSVGPYLLIALGLPVGMGLIGWLLGRLNRMHARVTGSADERPQQATWLRSMRGERGSTRQTGVLERVMVVSVGLALLAMAVWFFAFAGSSLPGSG